MGGVEVRSGSQNVKLTCAISEVETQPTFTWKTANGGQPSDDDYNIEDKELNTLKAESILTVKKATTADTEYTCDITGSDWQDEKQTIRLNVYGIGNIYTVFTHDTLKKGLKAEKIF